MFICESCASQRGQFIIAFSRGPCEVCSKVGNCSDEKYIKPLKPVPNTSPRKSIPITNKNGEPLAMTRADQLLIDISKGKKAQSELATLQNSCKHSWSSAVYDPKVTEAYTSPGDAPGTMGIDYRQSQYVPRKEEKRWSRICLKCRKMEYTSNTKPVAVEPVFS